MADSNQSIQMILIEADKWTEKAAEIIVEIPVSLTVNGELWLTFMCTPTDLEALALGFLYNEGLIQTMDEVVDVRLCPAGDNVDIWLHHPVEKPETWRRTSGCTGGFTTVDATRPEQLVAAAITLDGFYITPNQVSEFVEMLITSQDLYQKSGGVHTSAISDGKKVILAAEDIGRHNTLDKIAGLCLLRDLYPHPSIILTTGRISSEMLQKAARIGASFLISRTSPSSLSIHMAKDLGITVIGYARRNQFRVYSHPERIIPNDPTNKKEAERKGSKDHRDIASP